MRLTQYPILIHSVSVGIISGRFLISYISIVNTTSTEVFEEIIDSKLEDILTSQFLNRIF